MLYNLLNNLFTHRLTTYVVLRCHSRLLANYSRKSPSNYHSQFLWFRGGRSQTFTWQIIASTRLCGHFQEEKKKNKQTKKTPLTFRDVAFCNPFLLLLLNTLKIGDAPGTPTLKTWSVLAAKESVWWGQWSKNQILSYHFIWYFRLIKTSFLLLNEGNNITRADIHQKYFELNMWTAFNWV